MISPEKRGLAYPLNSCVDREKERETTPGTPHRDAASLKLEGQHTGKDRLFDFKDAVLQLRHYSNVGAL